MDKRRKKLHLAIELTVLLAVLFMALCPVRGSGYRRFATDTLRYIRAAVLEVKAETLSASTLGTGQKLGEQTLLVRLPLSYYMSIQPNASLTHIGMAAPISTAVGVLLSIGCYLYMNKKAKD